MTAIPDTLQHEAEVPAAHVAEEGRVFIRLHRNIANQHILFVISFVLLAITGFMVHIPPEVLDEFGIGEAVFLLRGQVHRGAAIVMVLVCIYHVYWVIVRAAGRSWLLAMLPARNDPRLMKENLLYYIGRRDSIPEFERFCYKHKAEYWALVAGNVLMTVSGVLLWTEVNWSKFILDIASVVHAMEAVLACSAILVWHMYEVHLRPHKFPGDMNWMKGVISEEEMKEEYGAHYKEIMADPELQDLYIKKPEKRRNRKSR